MKSFICVALAVCTICLVGLRAEALDLIYRDEKGTTHFRCINACGPVKVRKTGKCEYLVISIYFSGKVKACFAEKAGLQACGEIPLETTEPIDDGLVNTACLHRQ